MKTIEIVGRTFIFFLLIAWEMLSATLMHFSSKVRPGNRKNS
jgi:hypothetical protein